MNYTPEQIDDAFNAAPEKLQEFVMSDDAKESVDILCEGFNIIDPNNKELVSTDLLSLMVGLGTVEEFTRDLVNKCGLQEEDANGLIIDAYRILLRPAHVLGGEETQDNPYAAFTTPAQKAPAPAQAAPTSIPVQKTPTYNPPSPTPIPKPKNIDANIIGEIELPPPTIQPEIKDAPESRGEILHKIEVPRYTPTHTIPPTPSNLPTGSSRPQFAPTHPNTPPQPARPANILDAKLSGITSMPTEEVDVSQQKKPRYTGTDPYREPAE